MNKPTRGTDLNVTCISPLIDIDVGQIRDAFEAADARIARFVLSIIAIGVAIVAVSSAVLLRR